MTRARNFASRCGRRSVYKCDDGLWASASERLQPDQVVGDCGLATERGASSLRCQVVGAQLHSTRTIIMCSLVCLARVSCVSAVCVLCIARCVLGCALSGVQLCTCVHWHYRMPLAHRLR